MRNIYTILIICSYLYGWGNTGHRLVGEIAEDRLSNKAKREIKRIIGHHDLAFLSTWSDEIRSDPNWSHASTWHYATVPDGENYIKGKHRGDIIEKIKEFSEIANSSDADINNKKEALKWLVHLIGDLHQPLHVGNGKDRGGNSVKIKWFNEPTNLHKVWDEKLIEHQNLSYTEYANFLKLKFDNNTCRKWLVGDIISFAHESSGYRKICYDFDGDNLDYKYIFKTKSILDMRLMQAGVRLADLLNKIYI